MLTWKRISSNPPTWESETVENGRSVQWKITKEMSAWWIYKNRQPLPEADGRPVAYARLKTAQYRVQEILGGR